MQSMMGELCCGARREWNVLNNCSNFVAKSRQMACFLYAVNGQVVLPERKTQPE